MSKAYKDICPCKNCNKRTVVCHSICKEYKDWQKSGIEIEKKPLTNYIDFSANSQRRRKK